MAWFNGTKNGRRNARARTSARRRANLAEAKSYGEDDRMDVYERCNGLCDICGLPVPRERFHVEHREPVSGETKDDTWRNRFIAHPRCNLKKGAKAPKEKKAKAKGKGLQRRALLRRKKPFGWKKRELDPEAF